MINQLTSLLIIYVVQVFSRRKPASKIEKLLCIFQKFPVASFVFTTHCFQVCIAKLELLFSDTLYVLFWAEGLAFSVKVYLNLVYLSTLDDSLICATRIPYCCCCCYPTAALWQRWSASICAGEEQKLREWEVMHRLTVWQTPRSCHTQFGSWRSGVWCEVQQWDSQNHFSLLGELIELN